MSYPLPHVYRDDVPTRAELAADSRSESVGWFPTVPAGTDLLADLRAAVRAEYARRAGVDNAQQQV
jgi:hypothetical protein